MKFGDCTTLNLTIDSCHDIPSVRLKSELDADVLCEIASAIKLAKASTCDTSKSFEKDTSQCPVPSQVQNHNVETGLMETVKHLIDAEDKLEQLIPGCRDESEGSSPNPFVIVSLDEDDGGSAVIARTKTYRNTTRVLWQEDFKDIPLGLLAYGKWGRKMLTSGKKVSYCPSLLNFWLYHEKAGSENCSKSSWKSDAPKRDHFIGRASLNFHILMSSKGRKCHNIPVLDTLGNPIPGCYMKLQTEIFNPKATPDPGSSFTLSCQTACCEEVGVKSKCTTLEDFCKKQTKSRKKNCPPETCKTRYIKCHCI